MNRATSIFPWSGHLPDLARKAACRIGRAMNAEAVWLFGSVARGTPNDDSDIDLLVVVANDLQPRYRRAQRAHQLGSDIRAPKDVVVLTRKEWNGQLGVPTSLASTVLREGVLLYGC